MALVPPITALIGWITLGEKLSGMEFLGMGITLSGIVLVMSSKLEIKRPGPGKTLKMGPLVLGSLLALGGAVGQAAGLVLSKKGMQDMDPFSATQIRIMAGVLGFSIVITIFRRWHHLFGALKNLKAMKSMTLGSFTGPFLGVSLSLLAVQHTDTGIAATLDGSYPGDDYTTCHHAEKRKSFSYRNYRSSYLCGWGGPVFPLIRTGCHCRYPSPAGESAAFPRYAYAAGSKSVSPWKPGRPAPAHTPVRYP